MDSELLRKYNVPGPRYTSYPTVPYWAPETFSSSLFLETAKKVFLQSNQREGVSVYIHLPFCENLCTFCGCMKRITKNHSVEQPYIRSVLKEWSLYCDLFPEKPIIKELHLGGGTPTFFSPEHLRELINGLKERAEFSKEIQFSFEGHPNNTNRDHLETLYELGARRVCFGVQDYDVKVQKTINRVQPFEKVEKVTLLAREIGYESVGHDLVYGLPFQAPSSIRETIEKTRRLTPDRIAFYSYAHVPWIKGVGQRGFSQDDLPKDAEKRVLYELGKELFEELGYVEIGMDHFALPSDSLYQALQRKTLHRNFMGYCTSKTSLMIGLGVSAIGDSWMGFAQNNKDVEEYQRLVDQGCFPLFRGHILHEEDLTIRKHVLNLMCHFYTSWHHEEEQFDGLKEGLVRLEELCEDGIVILGNKELTVTEKGKPFVRNVCMAFDVRLMRNRPKTQLFSMTI